MDLIYMNRLFQDVGVLIEPEYDLAFGKDENDFSCKIHSSNHCCEPGFFIYADGTEYGGIVDSIEVDTEADTVTYSGRTWHGMLASKIIVPLQENEGSSKLPEGYTELEYIESSGTQYIDTGFKPNNNTKIVAVVSDWASTEKSTSLWGTQSDGSDRYDMYISSGGVYRSYYGGAYVGFDGAVSCNDRVTVERNGVSIAIGEHSLTNTAGTFSCTTPLYLFAHNNNGKLNNAASLKMYSFIIYDDGTLVRDYVPCKNASGVAGMYDVVGEQFYGSATETPFVAGDPVLPDAPSAAENLVISGDANACIAYLLERIGLPSALFTVPEDAAGVQIEGFQIDGYTDAYAGIRKMLASVGMRLQITHFDGQVVLAAVTKYDFSQDEEFESELVAFQSKTYYNKVNHLICLGAGEGADRIIVHLYTDENGNVSQNQTFFGVDEYAATYDKSGSLKTTADEGVTEEDVAADRAEKTADLIEDGTEKLMDMQTSDEISIDFDFDSDNYHVGDIVGSYDGNTGISVAAEITKKIVTIEGGQVKISYKVG